MARLNSLILFVTPCNDSPYDSVVFYPFYYHIHWDPIQLIVIY